MPRRVLCRKGRESSAPAGRRDQLYIVGFVYARIIWLSEVRSHCHGASCCCGAAEGCVLFFVVVAQLRETFQWRLSGLSDTLFAL